MQGKTRRWWPVVKTLLSLAILALIGWRFYKDLSKPELYQQPLAWGWLLPASLLYLAGMALSAIYWRRLMLHLGQPAPLAASFRAYFVSQLGKYVPGKMLALVMRAGMMRAAGTSAGLAGLTGFYEVLVTMAAGAVFALILFIVTDPWGVVNDRAEALASVLRMRPPENGRIDRLTLVVLSVGLCAGILTLISPAVLNRLVLRVSLLFRLGTPPALKTAWLREGLLITAPCWLLFGLAFACALEVIPGASLGWSLPTLAYLAAVMALAYVAGFVVPVAPGGLVVREFFLSVLLSGEIAARHGVSPALAEGQVLLAVLVLRVAWTAAEVLIAGVLYPLGPRPPAVSAAVDEGGPAPLPDRGQVA